ncbi:MAG: Aminotransferase, DegT/DnrJ/EryC1/StrS family [Berkelbacteria bacterium GW2011_GWA1_36_9]|uniref:Aminotransferase, DegT/DnrJ/EryC1/StrS family n=1 Tax=Berkelbacteria bacterium GW2011_GWA1_36_9 TaxID=1618331 RepID=A0A0G0FLC7_9BACT|nr:MAG: Aminotransferase, DegT/DnrJ/EryC1/StrS family [Berkelbacteria bacterium GW2011_GWA1_36_9]
MKISDKYTFLCDNDLSNVKKVIETKKFSGTSEVIGEYENKLASFFDSKYAIALSSGTAAIQTALFAAGVGNGDEVIISSTCPSMSIFPIIFIGARPVFCDTSVDSFGLKIEEIEKNINVKTRAIMEIPMWGYPTDVIKLNAFTKSKNIPLILDLAQAHGTKFNGKYLSSYGDISCFSTHDRKIIATGEGGFVLTNNEEYHKKAIGFIQFGNMNGVDFGLNYKLGALQAGLGISRIDFIKKQLEVRQKNANYIVSNIKSKFVEELKIVNGGDPNYYSLILKLNFGNNVEKIKSLEDSGIPSDVIRYNYKVLYEYPAFRRFKRVCPNSEKLVKNITTIPVHPALVKQELEYIIENINNLS